MLVHLRGSFQFRGVDVDDNDDAGGDMYTVEPAIGLMLTLWRRMRRATGKSS